MSINVQGKESGFTSLLLECIDVLHKNKIYNKDIRLFENNFKSLYKDINSLTSLNESAIPFTRDDNKPVVTLNQPDNVYAYLEKVSKLFESYETHIVENLNESFNPLEGHKKDNHDIKHFIKYVRDLIKELNKQNDFDKVPDDIMNIKITLNQPIRVMGFNLMKTINDPSMFAILYDKTFKRILFVSNKECRCYSIKTDAFETIDTVYDDFIDTSDYKRMLSVIKPNNFFQVVKSYLHNNFVILNTNVAALNLHYTDNMYQDQAQKSLVEDIKKKREIEASYQHYQKLAGGGIGMYKTNF